MWQTLFIILFYYLVICCICIKEKIDIKTVATINILHVIEVNNNQQAVAGMWQWTELDWLVLIVWHQLLVTLDGEEEAILLTLNFPLTLSLQPGRQMDN